MSDPDLRMAILREMATIRHELADLRNPMKPPLGPTEFTLRYSQQLKASLARLEKELYDAEAPAPD